MFWCAAHMPYSTPVLATLLAWVSGTRDPVQGGGLLLAYTCGYVTPLLVAATVAVSRLLGGRNWVCRQGGSLALGMQGRIHELMNMVVCCSFRSQHFGV